MCRAPCRVLPAVGTPAVLSEARGPPAEAPAPFGGVPRRCIRSPRARATTAACVSDDPPVRLPAAHREGPARRRGGALAPADGARGPDPPDGGGDVDMVARRLARAPARRADHP